MKRNLPQMAQESFDLVIVGGGISGVAIAREASLLNLKVALIEKQDFGSATSAATSKLIHGGLRYLKNMEFGLVRESLRERACLLQLAPHLVYPLPFLLPTYKSSSNSKRMIQMGMRLYDFLAMGYRTFEDPSKNLPAHQMLSPEEVMALEPKIYLQGLTGGALYYDCLNLNPERLTLSFLLSAYDKGAQVANYTKMLEFLREKNRVIGVRVRDELSGQIYEIRGKYVINACGPWTDLVLAGTREIKILRSQGIHLLTKKINQSRAIALQTPSKRHYFIIPWRGLSLIGTTDKPYKGEPDSYEVQSEHIDEFLKEINSTYDAQLTWNDIYYSYGGLRPLVDTQNDSYKASRRYEIEDHEKEGVFGLITVVGGKYTTSRQLAENVLRLIFQKLGKKTSFEASLKTPLDGGNIPRIEDFVKQALREHPDLDPTLLEQICRDRGTTYPKVLALLPEAGSLLKAEILYAIREEMALHLNDIVFRRIALATTGQPKEIESLAEIAAQELQWNSEEKTRQIRLFQKRYQVYQHASEKKV